MSTWHPTVGSVSCRYRGSDNRVWPAIITAVTDDETVDLRIGHGATHAGVPMVTHASGDTGWYRAGR